MPRYFTQPLDYNKACAKFGKPIRVDGSRFLFASGLLTNEDMTIVYCDPYQGFETIQNRLRFYTVKIDEAEQSFYHYQSAWAENPDHAPHDAVDRLKAMADTVRTLKAELAQVDSEMAATPEGRALAEQKRLREQAESERREQSSRRKQAIGSVTL